MVSGSTPSSTSRYVFETAKTGLHDLTLSARVHWELRKAHQVDRGCQACVLRWRVLEGWVSSRVEDVVEMDLINTNESDSVDALVAYLEGLGTQFSCFDSCLQGESSGVCH
jgi:hypothetical protein